jgi:hypothetical protein
MAADEQVVGFSESYQPVGGREVVSCGTGSGTRVHELELHLVFRLELPELGREGISVKVLTQMRRIGRGTEHQISRAAGVAQRDRGDRRRGLSGWRRACRNRILLAKETNCPDSRPAEEGSEEFSFSLGEPPRGLKPEPFFDRPCTSEVVP